ncbi:34314_t:CDS:2 [Gigaspora margarita]|uniref:34314_t:CDS:1 n=1 Tax=Gigaspora margarita TaxID=4874 RepID=A0ABN7W1S2_GIGMA|nr:34314_t:CDS:2 [Gigaspora margarita]
MDKKIFVLEIKQEPSKNSKSKVKGSLIEENSYPLEIVNKGSDQIPEKVKKHKENNNIDEAKEKNIENFNRLKIEVYNINRLRLDEEKLISLADQYNKDKMGIIGITETNIGEKEEKWLNTKHFGYASFWSK